MTKRELITEEHIVDILNKGLSKIEIDITREEVENMNFDYILSYINSIYKVSENNKDIFDVEFILMFSGYENDDREMYEIIEVKHYIKYILVKETEFFAFLDKESKESIIIFVAFEINKNTIDLKVLCDFMLEISNTIKRSDKIPKKLENKTDNDMLNLLDEILSE